jgi:8-amino-7-oxononanoate synthase
VLSTITHIHMSVIPVLAGSGTIFLDGRAHKTIYDGSMAAQGHGATVVRFRHDDVDHLRQLLRGRYDGPALVCLDGVNSMTGNAPDLESLAAVAREHDAILYVDDAHGFGVIGERDADELCPYGTRGNSIVRHLGQTYDNVVLVGGFSKAYSSLLAFIACPPEMKRILKTAAPPYLFSGPSPVASLATVLEGFRVNRECGDVLRADIYAKTKRVLDHLVELGVDIPNRSGYPIVEIPIADSGEIDRVGDYLFDRGVYVTLAAYPLVPRHEVGFRVQITAANPDSHIDLLLDVLTELADRSVLPAGRARLLAA